MPGTEVLGPDRPITVALVDDYDVVVLGVANIIDRYRDRVVVAEIDTNSSVEDVVDIVLYDSFAQPESDHQNIDLADRATRARSAWSSTRGTSTPS